MSIALRSLREEVRQRVVRHAVAAVEAAEALDRPFSHFFVENVFPNDIYAQMIDDFPAAECYQPLNLKHHSDATGRSTRDVLPLDAQGLSQTTNEQRDFWLGIASALTAPELQRVVFAKLATDLSRRFGCSTAAVQQLKAYPRPTLFRDSDGYAIAPHPDTRHKIVTMQLYLPRDRSQIELGTALYRRKLTALGGLIPGKHGFEKVKQFPFLPNSGYAFCVSNSIGHKSWHGREALPSGSGSRDTILNMYFDEPGRRY